MDVDEDDIDDVQTQPSGRDLSHLTAKARALLAYKARYTGELKVEDDEEPASSSRNAMAWNKYLAWGAPPAPEGAQGNQVLSAVSSVFAPIDPDAPRTRSLAGG